MNNVCGHFPLPEAGDIITPSDQLAKVISWRREGLGCYEPPKPLRPTPTHSTQNGIIVKQMLSRTVVTAAADTQSSVSRVHPKSNSSFKISHMSKC